MAIDRSMFCASCRRVLPIAGLPTPPGVCRCHRFQSNALWPAGVCPGMYGDNITTDTHDTHEAAAGVCVGLLRDGFGGERKAFPLKVWVSDVQQPPRLPEVE